MMGKFSKTLVWFLIVNVLAFQQAIFAGINKTNVPSTRSATSAVIEKTAPVTVENNAAAVEVPKNPQANKARSFNGSTAKRTVKNRALSVSSRAAARKVIRFNDCDDCHTACFVGSLACIAVSIATGCLPCGLICLGLQAACDGACTQTASCQGLAN